MKSQCYRLIWFVVLLVYVAAFPRKVHISAKCKPGWYNVKDTNYCWRAILLNDNQFEWHRAIPLCADKTYVGDIQNAYPLIEKDSKTLDSILASKTHPFLMSGFVVGLLNGAWFDSDTTMPYRNCTPNDFHPWDIYAHEPGECGFIIRPYYTNKLEYCVAWLNCKQPDYYINQLNLICQYQMGAQEMECPPNFIPGPLGDRCFFFDRRTTESWTSAFCQSVYQGHELAVTKNVLDFWWTSMKLSSITDVDIGAFVGITALKSNDSVRIRDSANTYSWIDGDPLQGFYNLCFGIHKGGLCVTQKRSTQDLYDYRFDSCYEEIDCREAGTSPVVYQYTPGSGNFSIPNEILCAVAYLGKPTYQYCKLLLDKHCV